MLTEARVLSEFDFYSNSNIRVLILVVAGFSDQDSTKLDGFEARTEKLIYGNRKIREGAVGD